MNFNHLKQIVKILKNKITCPFCDHIYKNEDIHVVASTPNEATFYVSCHYCRLPIIATVIFTKKTIIENALIEIQPLGKAISQNEILDMHNFLKNFSGDLTKYLKK